MFFYILQTQQKTEPKGPFVTFIQNLWMIVLQDISDYYNLSPCPQKCDFYSSISLPLLLDKNKSLPGLKTVLILGRSACFPGSFASISEAKS